MPLPGAGKYGGKGTSNLPTTQKTGSLPTAGKYGATGGANTGGGGGKKKGFLGINLPTIGIAGHNLVDLPAVGVTTDKHNPLTQISNTVTGFVPGIVKSVYGLSK